jgi:enoyl-[acyl-carrier-protein] reductase (NADH)
LALDVSTYSLVALARASTPLMQPGSSIVTMTYYGSEKAVPGYNVMGVAKAALEASVRYLAIDLGQKNIRINAISAGAINTLAARGVRDFRVKLDAFNRVFPVPDAHDHSIGGASGHFQLIGRYTFRLEGQGMIPRCRELFGNIAEDRFAVV